MAEVLNHHVLTEAEPHLFVGEASTIGLEPGVWPAEIATRLGNGQPFIRTSKKVDADNDIMWVTYVQALGCVRLRVLND